jgi:hypothetical protein
VPENDVSVVDGGVAVGDPFWDTFGWLARCLGNMAAGWVELLVVI